VGDGLAERVTDDHGTYFAGWEAGRALASRVTPDQPSGPSGPSQSPSASGSPAPTGAASAATPAPAHSPRPAASSSTSASPAETPSGSPLATTTETGHPTSFLIDPESRAEAPLPWRDMWQPTVDPLDSSVVFWSGTLVRDVGSLDWRLGSGRILLDSWAAAAEATASLTPDPSALPSEEPGPSAAARPTPSASAVGRPSVRPSIQPVPGSTFPGAVGTPGASDAAVEPVVLADGDIGSFQARFDPTATRLALWTTDPTNAPTPGVGLLRLILVDPATASVQTISPDPLPGVPALADFSIDAGRLAWVTPPGQDGEGSLVRILAWSGDSFGQVQTFPAERLYVVR
jgi:hypothetical protein